MKYNIYQKINSGQPVVTCIDGGTSRCTLDGGMC